MLKRIGAFCRFLLLVLLLCKPVSLCAQEDTSVTNTILEHKLLVLTSIKHPEKRFALDSSGIISIVYVNYSDSLIANRYRQLSGKLLHFDDSSLVLHVHDETISTYRRDKTNGFFYYSIEQDSTRHHLDTILFSDVSTLRFDKGRFRLLISFLQSSTYVFGIGNIGVLITALILPNNYANLVSGQNALLITTVAVVAGGSSFFFYPKQHLIQPQPHKKRKKPQWKLEVI